jgi:hypothetical protein
MQRKCPECRRTRTINAGDPLVARCVCGARWCFLCRATLTVEEAVPDDAIGPRALELISALSTPVALDCALAANHALPVPAPWTSQHGIKAIVTNAAADAPLPRRAGCPMYLEQAEHLFPGTFDAGRGWTDVMCQDLRGGPSAAEPLAR